MAKIKWVTNKIESFLSTTMLSEVKALALQNAETDINQL